MTFSLTNRALLRGMLAGAVVLTGTACSRSDRTESGRDNSAAVLPDTTSAQFPGSGTATGAVSDTATTSAQPSISAQPKSPRAETASPGDKDAAGYRSMKRDTTSMSETSAATDTAVVDAAIDAPADVADTSSTEMAGAADTAANTDVSHDTTATGYVNGAGSVAAFTLLKDLYDQGCISPNLLGGGIPTDAGHATGQYAMIIDGPWMVDIYKGNYPDFKVNFAPIPAAGEANSSVVGGEDVVLFDTGDSARQAAAMKWAAFLLSEDAQKMMAEVGVVPTLAGLIGDSAMPEYFGVFLEQLKTAQARVPHPKWSDMDNAINNAFQRMLRGEQTPQAALDQAAEEINALLQ